LVTVWHVKETGWLLFSQYVKLRTELSLFRKSNPGNLPPLNAPRELS
jgi:hypothetical protein